MCGGRVPLWAPSVGGLRMAIPGHKLLAEVRETTCTFRHGLYCETAFSGRFLYGTGESISMWAVLGVAVSQYPDRVATLIGAYGTFFGLGYLGGPVVGSLLYSVGGLALPFELVGAAGFLVTLLAMYSIPSTSKGMEEEEEEDEVDDEKSSEQEQTKSLTMLSTITVGQINYFPGKKSKKKYVSHLRSLSPYPSLSWTTLFSRARSASSRPCSSLTAQTRWGCPRWRSGSFSWSSQQPSSYSRRQWDT